MPGGVSVMAQTIPSADSRQRTATTADPRRDHPPRCGTTKETDSHGTVHGYPSHRGRDGAGRRPGARSRRPADAGPVRRGLPEVLGRRGQGPGLLPGRRPERRRARAVHQEAHGLVADTIHPWSRAPEACGASGAAAARAAAHRHTERARTTTVRALFVHRRRRRTGPPAAEQARRGAAGQLLTRPCRGPLATWRRTPPVSRPAELAAEEPAVVAWEDGRLLAQGFRGRCGRAPSQGAL